MDDFANTRAGRKFIDWTMPELVHQLKKLNEHLEKLIAIEDEPVKSIGEINKEFKENYPKETESVL